MKKEQFINRIKNELLKLEPESQIYLFGSRARNDFDTDSDWDILVLSPRKKITFDYELSLREPILNLEIETGEVVSLLVFSKEDWLAKQNISTLFHNVTNEGILVN